MRNSRVDDNQAAIVLALRSAGATVQSLANVRKGCPDILVGYHGVNLLMEIKNDRQPMNKRKLTPDEQHWIAMWKGQVVVVHNVNEATEVLWKVFKGEN
jgi:Holliday junction resolvase